MESADRCNQCQLGIPHIGVDQLWVVVGGDQAEPCQCFEDQPASGFGRSSGVETVEGWSAGRWQRDVINELFSGLDRFRNGFADGGKQGQIPPDGD